MLINEYPDEVGFRKCLQNVVEWDETLDEEFVGRDWTSPVWDATLEEEFRSGRQAGGGHNDFAALWKQLEAASDHFDKDEHKKCQAICKELVEIPRADLPRRFRAFLHLKLAEFDQSK